MGTKPSIFHSLAYVALLFAVSAPTWNFGEFRTAFLHDLTLNKFAVKDSFEFLDVILRVLLLAMSTNLLSN